jgi:hypothetical protein
VEDMEMPLVDGKFDENTLGELLHKIVSSIDLEGKKKNKGTKIVKVFMQGKSSSHGTNL